MNKQLEVKLKKIVGQIHRVNVLDEQGCTSEVRQIITDNGSYLLKSSFEEKYREWLINEAQVLEKLNNSNQIPVPIYYGIIEERDSSHLIMSFENGITLSSALKKAKNKTEKKSLIRSFGHLLYCLHETNIIESLNRKNDWLVEQLIKAENYVESGQTEGSLELLQQLKLNKPLSLEQTMIHGDCTTDNVLVLDGEVRLFIDVAGMTVGDPRYDESLAISSFVNNEEYKSAFYEGYKRYKVSNEEFQYFDEGLYEFF
ncbi:aminoglycoside phosphotransferase family protein [Chengkuizengella marina]|uniref:Aminoglycoside phosphotransferase family protein n=1 Tax=Chengkuizengella marina TaxID=2507566 RepID=A0A6N9Q1P5_9BACL|nr:aminoglycoside phosphotransferase family protein [Chengkuizengella marina]NBI29035.1 aminoglycoside phosphotransferase family protein [Chengkuizengella marina]